MSICEDGGVAVLYAPAKGGSGGSQVLFHSVLFAGEQKDGSSIICVPRSGIVFIQYLSHVLLRTLSSVRPIN
jgi:hypothetical protein